MRGSVALPLFVAAVLTDVTALGADTPAAPPLDPGSPATPIWALLQLLPSPEMVVWEGVVHFGARFQVTPFCYSFGINRKLFPLRTFVVEPAARHSGSIELYLSPELLTGSSPKQGDHWVFRAGLRSYVPLLDRGEALSASLGGSLFFLHERAGAALDLGLHTMGGLVGVRWLQSPTPGLRMTTLALEIRIF